MSAVTAQDPSAGAPLARLRGFHPGWYGAVMGTAIVGIVAYQDPGHIAGLGDAARAFGVGMVVLAAVLAVVLGIPYVVRWLRHPDAARADLANPVAGALYGTFPGGILVLAVGIATVGPSLAAAEVVTPIVAILATGGIILAFAVSVLFASLLFVSHAVEPQSANGAWFIPPVVNIIVPMVLVPLAPHVAAADLPMLVVAGYAFWGMGFLLFVLVASLLYDRLVFHPLPAAPLAPLAVDRARVAGRWEPVAPASRPGGCAAVGNRRACRGRRLIHRRGHAVGVRLLVDGRHRRAAGGVPAPRTTSLRARLVGLHVPPRRIHG
jgi:tellurite resistance protein TehA-like permease